MSAADNKVAEIRTEIARRKKLWNQLVEIVRQAYAAVNREAKRRGITYSWIGFDKSNNPACTIWVTASAEQWKLKVKLQNGKVEVELKSPSQDSQLYGGYPRLTRKDLERGWLGKPILDSVVQQLMIILNENK